MEVGRRPLWIGILSRPSHGSYSLSPGDGLANLHKDLLEMGIVVISALDRFIDPDGVTASNRTQWLPIRVDGNNDSGRSRDDIG